MEPLYNGHLWGTKFWPLYRGGLCRGVVLCTDSSFGTRVPGRYIAVGFSSGVAVKRGSTVYLQVEKTLEMKKWSRNGKVI